MAEHVLSIEIGNQLVKVVEVDYKVETPRVYQAFYFETPEGTLNEKGLVMENNQFRAMLLQGLKKHNIKTRKVVFSIDTTKIGSKEESIPDMKENRLKEYIQTNVKTFFPVNPDHYQVVYRINGKTEDGNNRVQLYAVPTLLIASYEDIAKYCELTIVDMELMENGIARLLMKLYSNKIVANASIEGNYSSITIINNGEVALQRTVPYGVGDAINAVIDSNFFGDSLTFVDTLVQMKDTSCFLNHSDEIDTSNDEVKKVATDEARYVVGNINRILDYFSSQHNGAAIDRIIVDGIASECQGFFELLSNELGTEVVSAKDTVYSNVKGASEGDISSLYLSNIAAVYCPIGITIENFKKKKGLSFDMSSSKRSAEDLGIAKKVFFGCLILSAVLLLVPALLYAFNSKQKSHLESQIAALQDAKEVNDDYLATSQKYKQIESVAEQTETPNDKVLDFYTEMEGVLPSNVKISDFNADASGITITFISQTKEQASKTITEFRKFDTVDLVSVDSLAAVTDDTSQTSGYSFSLYCTYKTADAAKESEAK